MGAVDVNLAEVLLFPQNKIQLTTKVMSVPINDDDCEHTDHFCGCGISMTKPKHLGNLTIWFRLTCELDVLKSLFADFDQRRMQKNPSTNVENETMGSSDVPMIGQQQQQQQQKMTSIEAAPTKSTTQCHDPDTDKNMILITIQSLKFNVSFQLPTSVDTQIHIECNFLGSRRLKTSPQPLSHGIDLLRFNFTQAYPQNERNFQRLMNILKDPEHSIKFTLIETKATATNELVSAVQSDGQPQQPPPLPLSEKSIAAITSDDESKHECNEIGFGLLHFGKFMRELNFSSERNNESLHTFTIPILSKKPPYQNIGQLDVTIEHLNTLQKSIQQQHLREINM